jgi:pimeloyl-ACP methyl ester carboxylesterase
MPTIRVNGTSLYYEEQGAGPGVIFVHGSWSDHGTWAAVVEPLASQFRAVTYDRRGTHGVSGHRSRGRLSRTRPTWSS